MHCTTLISRVSNISKVVVLHKMYKHFIHTMDTLTDRFKVHSGTSFCYLKQTLLPVVQPSIYTLYECVYVLGGGGGRIREYHNEILFQWGASILNLIGQTLIHSKLHCFGYSRTRACQLSKYASKTHKKANIFSASNEHTHFNVGTRGQI